MKRLTSESWTIVIAVATLTISASAATPIYAQPQANPADAEWAPPEGEEVLTRGPIHEAYAEPVTFDPKPGPSVPQQCPEAIEELPPDQKPSGQDVQWIPGYWSWDDERDKFIWISGIWRDIPPGQEWVPGYWTQVQGGYQWISGFWAATTDSSQPVQYLPEPPESQEIGPNTPAPSNNHFWAPGCWYWVDSRYVWRPGVWVESSPNWVWTPPCYRYTPVGYVFVNGFWDYPVVSRGVVFAPINFVQPVYLQPTYVVRPTITIVANVLVDHLFCRPRLNHYYFGDYYDPGFRTRGFYAWHNVPPRIGYDPIFNYYRAQNVQVNNVWVNNVTNIYNQRVTNVNIRPPRTYRAQLDFERRVRTPQGEFARNLQITREIDRQGNINVRRELQIRRDVGLAQPIQRVAQQNIVPTKFETVTRERREVLAKRATELQAFRTQRSRLEREAAIARPAQTKGQNDPPRVRTLEMPRSPIARPMPVTTNRGGPMPKAENRGGNANNNNNLGNAAIRNNPNANANAAAIRKNAERERERENAIRKNAGNPNLGGPASKKAAEIKKADQPNRNANPNAPTPKADRQPRANPNPGAGLRLPENPLNNPNPGNRNPPRPNLGNDNNRPNAPNINLNPNANPRRGGLEGQPRGNANPNLNPNANPNLNPNFNPNRNPRLNPNNNTPLGGDGIPPQLRNPNQNPNFNPNNLGPRNLPGNINRGDGGIRIQDRPNFDMQPRNNNLPNFNPRIDQNPNQNRAPNFNVPRNQPEPPRIQMPQNNPQPRIEGPRSNPENNNNQGQGRRGGGRRGDRDD